MFNISFRGCAPRHYLKGNNGKFYVIPIKNDPNLGDIYDAIKSSDNQANFIGDGTYGDVYSLGRDLVVKKYCVWGYPKEVDNLDRMYDKNILSKGIQKGCFAFKPSHGSWYLVSEKMPGELAEIAKLNQDNLSYLTEALLELDKPRQDEAGNYGIYEL